MVQLETIGLSNGQYLRVAPGKLLMSRRGGVFDAVKSIAALAFATISFVVTGASIAAIREGEWLSALPTLALGSVGLFSAWLVFRASLGAIAGMPETVMEIQEGKVWFLGSTLEGPVEFSGFGGRLSVYDSRERMPLVNNLVPEEALAVASHLNSVFFQGMLVSGPVAEKKEISNRSGAVHLEFETK